MTNDQSLMVNVWFRQILILTPWGLLGFNEAYVNIFDKRIEPNLDFYLEVVQSTLHRKVWLSSETIQFFGHNKVTSCTETLQDVCS